MHHTFFVFFWEEGGGWGGGWDFFGKRLRRTVVSEPGRLIGLQLDVVSTAWLHSLLASFPRLWCGEEPGNEVSNIGVETGGGGGGGGHQGHMPPPPSFQSVPYTSCTTNKILHTVPPPPPIKKSFLRLRASHTL